MVFAMGMRFGRSECRECCWTVLFCSCRDKMVSCVDNHDEAVAHSCHPLKSDEISYSFACEGIIILVSSCDSGPAIIVLWRLVQYCDKFQYSLSNRKRANQTNEIGGKSHIESYECKFCCVLFVERKSCDLTLFGSLYKWPE